jgi:hypothetical protein
VPATGVRARCSVCGGVIAIAGGTLPIAVTPSSVRAVSGIHAAPLAGRAPSTPPSVPAVTAVAPTVVSAIPTPSIASRPFAPPVAPSPAPVPAPAPAVAPTLMTPPAPAGMAPLAPARIDQRTPAAVPVSGATGTAATGTPGAGKRSINPFLNADPGQRARRLARALVSDLVAYHPQKREDGLRDGTLRQLFREEIKKSYEEFVEQVGRELAESSPHFQDALNEILGGGRKLF